jgi:hypothetical protein
MTDIQRQYLWYYIVYVLPINTTIPMVAAEEAIYELYCRKIDRKFLIHRRG